MTGNRGGIRGDQRGFTLPEVLVTILIMLTVLFALYGVFDAGIRIFSVGNDKLEATERARVGIEKMSREVRAAYPQSGDILLDGSSNAQRITFQNKPYSTPATSITYAFDGSSTLTRNGEPVVEGVSSFALSYCVNPAEPGTCTAATGSNTRLVRVRMTVTIAGSPQQSQTVATDIYLRNRL